MKDAGKFIQVFCNALDSYQVNDASDLKNGIIASINKAMENEKPGFGAFDELVSSLTGLIIAVKTEYGSSIKKDSHLEAELELGNELLNKITRGKKWINLKL